MSNDNKSKKLPSQAKKLASIKKQIDRNYNKFMTAETKAIYKAAKKREKDLRQLYTLTAIKGKGIYEPKSDTLTKYRKTRLNKIAAQFGEILNIEKFTFVEAPKSDRKSLIERATGLDFKTSKTGFFVPKKGNKRVKLKKDKKRNEYYVETSGRVKQGERKGKIYKSIIPLASADDLTAERARLENMAEKLGPLKKGEKIGFLISENGVEGASHNAYPNIKLLMEQLERYQKTTAARIQFYRHITIVKTTDVVWHKEHPIKPPKRFGRNIRSKGINAKGRNIY